MANSADDEPATLEKYTGDIESNGAVVLLPTGPGYCDKRETNIKATESPNKKREMSEDKVIDFPKADPPGGSGGSNSTERGASGSDKAQAANAALLRLREARKAVEEGIARYHKVKNYRETWKQVAQVHEQDSKRRHGGHVTSPDSRVVGDDEGDGPKKEADEETAIITDNEDGKGSAV